MAPNTIILMIFSVFILSNLLNSYFLTTKRLNRYIVPFKHTFKGEANAIIGNSGTLLFFLFTGMFLFANAYNLLLYLLILSLVLNSIFFALSVFNLYYGNAFSMSGLEIFKNPAEGISKGLFKEFTRELFIYYRILLFLPTILLTTLLFFATKEQLLLIDIKITPFTYVLYLSLTLILLILSYHIYKSMFLKELPINSAQSTFGIQNYGVYPYYISHFLFQNFESNIEYLLKIQSDNDLIRKIQSYNKNQKSYYNHIESKKYSNILTKDQVVDTIKISPKLSPANTLNGILKHKNLMLIQVESMNKFLLEIEKTKAEMPFLQSILKESVVFNNFYTNVGIGVSSDAEITTLTGLYPSGTDNYYWKHYNNIEKDYEVINKLTTIPKYFNAKNYNTKAIHGDKSVFYNRLNAYNDLIGFNDFYSLESFKDKILERKIGFSNLYKYEYEANKFHISPWASDYQLFDRVNELSLTEKTNYMYFPVTMMPHTPFEYHPYTNININHYGKDLKPLTKKYLSFSSYYDQIIKRIFFKDGKNITNSNTVYLFYGDHGSGLKNGDLNKLFDVNKHDDPLFEREKLQKIVSFLYVPSEEITTTDSYKINKGLIVGTQNLVRGQIDIYRTIIELFDLNIKNDVYFGVNLLSKEKTFVLDNKLLDVATDEAFFSLRNPKHTKPINTNINASLLKTIKETKLIHDLIFNVPGTQEKINRLLNQNK